MIAFRSIDDDFSDVEQPANLRSESPWLNAAVSDDPYVAELLHLARNWHGEPPTIKELCKRLSISRRSLEQRCRAVLGRSPMKEIRRFNLERAAQMLVETKSPVKSIAYACGFSNPIHLSVAFRRQFGVSPSGFRRNSLHAVSD